MSANNSGGMGFFGVMTLVFVTLKLTEVIDWSWWWVLAPLWLPATLGMIAVIMAFMVAGVRGYR